MADIKYVCKICSKTFNKKKCYDAHLKTKIHTFKSQNANYTAPTRDVSYVECQCGS